MTPINDGFIVTDKKIRELLNEMATIMPSEYDTSNYCYLPYWFQVTDDQIVAYHINGLPNNLKKQVEKYREILEKK